VSSDPEGGSTKLPESIRRSTSRVATHPEFSPGSLNPQRIVFLIPELREDNLLNRTAEFFRRNHDRFAKVPFARALGERLVVHPYLFTSGMTGGTLNIIRNCVLVRSLGIDAVVATASGKNTYGHLNIASVPLIRWSERTVDDVCVVPDFCSNLVDTVKGTAVAYLQAPHLVRREFDYQRNSVVLWTDSPFMLERCQEVLPGKDIKIVPNIVDEKAFPFRPQSERTPGLLFAFPRKGPEFIAATKREYEALGGKYWHFELIEGLSLNELARRMQEAQAFLASADVEGCALPPQESMAAGIVVVGKDARGANFSMQHKETSMLANTPEEAARALVELEDAELRDRLSRNGHQFISRYFPSREPTDFWLGALREFGFKNVHRAEEDASNRARAAMLA
jgi:glycosyltransferase involved in cell wall biosynthesis